MTRPVLRAAGTLLLLSTLAAIGATPSTAAQAGAGVVTTAPAPKPPAPVKAPAPPSPTAQALHAALGEVRAGRATASYAQWLDSLPGFRFSGATAALLVRQLGTDKLFTVQRQDAAGGAREYVLSAPALRHTAPDGSSIAWDPMRATLQLQADGHAATNRFSVPRLTMEDNTARFTLRNLQGALDSADIDSPYGDMKAEVDAVQILTKPDGSTIAMDGLFAKVAVTDRGDKASMLYETGMRTLTVQGERLDDLHLALRVSGIDKAALEKSVQLGKQIEAQQQRQQQQQQQRSQPPTAAERSALMLPVLRQLGLALMAKGAVMDLDDLSIAYRGSTARLHGQAHLEAGAPADLDQPAMLLKKIVVHADLGVPVAMVRAFTENMAKKQLARQQSGADAATIAKAGAAIYDAMLRAALANGYVRVEGDMLVTTIDVRDGAVRINGKPLPLPRPDAPVAAEVAAVNRSTGMMRARRIAEKCLLPAFPPEVVAGDQALSLALQLTVNPDGSVGRLALTRPSDWPAYDQAVLAAAARCTYIPALRNGQPVAVSEVWEVVRVPGSARP